MLFHRVCSVILGLVALYLAWGAIHLIRSAIVQPFATFGEWIIGFIFLVGIFVCMIDLAKGAYLAEKGYRKAKQEKEEFKQYIRRSVN